MLDKKKFCRPKSTLYPKSGDIEVKFKYGNKVNVSYKEFKKVQNNFKISGVTDGIFIGYIDDIYQQEDNNEGFDPGSIIIGPSLPSVTPGPTAPPPSQEEDPILNVVNEKRQTGIVNVGDIITINEELGIVVVFPTNVYSKIKNKYTYYGVVGELIIIHENNITLAPDESIKTQFENIDAMFLYEDWINISDVWIIQGFYNIETYTEEQAKDGDYVIMANGTTLIIDPDDYSKVSSHWEHVDTIVKE